MNCDDFNFVADFSVDGAPPPSMLFVILLGKAEIMNGHEELESLLNTLEHYGKVDAVVETINNNTLRAIHNLRFGDDLFSRRNDEELRPEYRKNMSATLNCITNDAVRAVRLAKEVVHAYLERPTGTLLQ